ncbi:MAG TPA: ABC transporter substrate-binding protein [Gammaproteobacteria bacterium]
MSGIRLIAFPGAPNLPLFTAIEKGFFEEAGVNVELETTPSSSYQIESLVAGRYDLAATAFDNVVAYRDGQGAVEFASPPDLFAFLGATRLELSFVVAPEVGDYEDVRGGTLALDALGTGFAFVLYEMLRQAGLDAGDYDAVPVGATPQRWESVKSGEHLGTLTIEPFTSIALANGFRVLASSGDLFEHYQGGIFATSRGWAERHEDELLSFIRGYLRGLEWTLDPRNYDEGAARLQRNMPAIKAAFVDAVMAKLLAAETGLTPGGEFDLEGVETVLELRGRYGRPERRLGGAERYLDQRYLERARAS